MQISLEKDNILNTYKSLSKELALDKDLDNMKEQFNKIVQSTFDKMVNYTIKSMPIPDALKNVLTDIKQSFKTKDFKEIIKTVINSSVREGAEMLGISKETIKSFKVLKNTAIKGGLFEGIKAGIDLIAKKYLKNNIVGNYIYDFFNQIKNLPFTKIFSDKLSKSISKIDDLKKDLLEKCKKFKEAYSEFDFEKMEELYKDITESSKKIKDDECIREVNNIQNINKLVNIKKTRLTDEQLKLCNIM